MFVVLQGFKGAVLRRQELEKQLTELEEWPGFLSLELLERVPAEQGGAEEYMMLTRWRFREDYLAWSHNGSHAYDLTGGCEDHTESYEYLLRLRRDASYFRS